MGQCLVLKRDKTLHPAGDLMTIEDMTADATLGTGKEVDSLGVSMIEETAEVEAVGIETGGDIR